MNKLKLILCILVCYGLSLTPAQAVDPGNAFSPQISGVSVVSADVVAINPAQSGPSVDVLMNNMFEPDSGSIVPSVISSGPDAVNRSLSQAASPSLGATRATEFLQITLTGINMGGHKIINLPEGVAETDAVNVKQLNDAVQNAGGALSVVVDNGEYDASGKLIFKGGRDEADLTEKNIGVVVDDDQKTTTVKLSKNLDGMNSVKFGPKPEGQPDNSVSISSKGLDNGGHQIKNVAAGDTDTDAVNVAQLKRAVQKGDQQYRTLDAKIDHTESRMRKFSNANAASALATANIPQVYAPGKNAVGVGLGNMNGQSAVAVGISTINEKGDWIFKGTATVNSEGQGVGGGASYVW